MKPTGTLSRCTAHNVNHLHRTPIHWGSLLPLAALVLTLALTGGGVARADTPSDAAPSAEEATEATAAATAPTPPAKQAPSAEQLHESLRQLQRTMQDALNQGDVDAIVANIHEDVVFTTMNGDVVRGQQGVRDYFEHMMQGPDKVVEEVRTTFEADDLSVLHGGDTAVAYGSTDDHYVLTSGDTFDVQARWSGTMVRDGDRWVVGSFHYSTNMFDNPILSAQRTVLIWVAVIAALAAAAVAFFVGRKLAA